LLHPTYEGEASLKTSAHQTASLVDKKVGDPTGQGRRRQVQIRKDSRGHLDLNVFWGETKKGNGKVSVHTSQADAVLQL